MMNDSYDTEENVLEAAIDYAVTEFCEERMTRGEVTHYVVREMSKFQERRKTRFLQLLYTPERNVGRNEPPAGFLSGAERIARGAYNPCRITKREKLAGLVLQGMLAGDPEGWPMADNQTLFGDPAASVWAREAVKYADALIAELERTA